MPATQSSYDQIKINQEKAASLNKEAAGMESAAFTLGDKVMEAVRTDRTQRGVSKLATDVGNVMGQMVSDPNAIREGPESLSAQGLVDPFSVNQLTSNARAQNLRTLGTIATQTAANQGSIDEVIQAGANQLKARAQTLLAEAEKATAAANSLQQEWDRQMQEKENQETIRQFNVKLEEDRRQFGVIHAGDVIGQGDEKYYDTDKPSSNANLISPPSSGIPGSVQEFPKGSGVFWVANQKGVWE